MTVIYTGKFYRITPANTYIADETEENIFTSLCSKNDISSKFHDITDERAQEIIDAQAESEDFE